MQMLLVGDCWVTELDHVTVFLVLYAAQQLANVCVYVILYKLRMSNFLKLADNFAPHPMVQLQLFMAIKW